MSRLGWRTDSPVVDVLALSELGNFFGLLCLFMFFFAVLALHLFGGSFGTLEEYPRDNFDTFGTALLTVFQILTGENWNAVMFNTVETNGYTAILYFKKTVSFFF